MPVQLSNSLKGASGSLTSNPALFKIFSSSLWTSVIITVLIMFILMFICPFKNGTSFGLIFKIGFYVFVTSLSMVYLNNSMIKSITKSQVKEGARESIINALKPDIVNGGNKIKPNLMEQVGIPAELYE